MNQRLVSIHRSRELAIEASAPRAKRIKRPTPERPLILSASELRDFLRCRVRWAWRHQLGIVPRKKPIPLTFGGLGHQILAAWYALPERERTVKRMRRIAKRILGATNPEDLDVKDLELLEAMCVGYAEWAKPRDEAIGLEKLQPERWFELPLTKDGSIRVRGAIDATFRVGSLRRTVGCFEHKFKSQIRIDAIDLNLQLSVYLWALRQLYPEAKRYIAYYNVLRKQMPGPRVKADLFARESVERTDEEIDQWAIDTERIALDMLDAAIYPNPMDNCSWDCDYQVPCMLRGRPDDMAVVFQRDFKDKDDTDTGENFNVYYE